MKLTSNVFSIISGCILTISTAKYVLEHLDIMSQADILKVKKMIVI